MIDGTDADLYEQFKLEFREFSKDQQPIMIMLTKLQAWALFAQIQLALRHPANKGPTSDVVRHIAVVLEKEVAKTPAMAELARRGWDKRYDMEVPQ
jgi:hypothetical protein